MLFYVAKAQLPHGIYIADRDGNQYFNPENEPHAVSEMALSISAACGPQAAASAGAAVDTF